MDSSAQNIVKAATEIIREVVMSEKELVMMAEDKEKQDLRESVYDMEQAISLLNRAVSR